jgi:hypothetical protein
MTKLGILLLAALPLAAQEVRLPPDLSRLAAKAVETVDVNLEGPLLQMAGKFLSNEKPDEARAKALISGLKSIQVKSFEFAQPGQYLESDVEAIRSQLRGPGWSRIVGVVSKREGENAEIFTKTVNDKICGLVIVAAEPRELTVVNIVGTIDLDQLTALGGQFGVPRVELPPNRKKD